MIGVFLRPDYTQVIIGKKKKNMLHLTDYKVIEQNYLKALEMDAISAVEAWRYFFQDVQSVTGRKNDEIFLVLPDYLFTTIDCFPSESPQDINNYLINNLSIQLEDVYYSVPIITSPEAQQPIVTVCAIRQEIVNFIIEAARNENVHLISIEPASVSMLRGECTYNKETLALFMYKDKATFIGYSPNGGIFKMDNDDLSINNLKTQSAENVEDIIMCAMNEFELTAEKTFEYLNQNLPYMVFSSDSDFTDTIKVIATRKDTPRCFNRMLVDDNNIQEHIQQEWLFAGTLLQFKDFSDDMLSEYIDSYMQIVSGNVLPEYVQMKSKKFHQLQHMMKLGCYLLAFLAVLSLVEAVAIMFFSSTHIPKELQQDYDSGQATIRLIEEELNLIKQEQNEDQQVMEAYKAVMSVRPQEISFIEFEAGNVKKTSEWIKIKLISSDPLKFQSYVKSLSDSGIFSSVNIPQIVDNGNVAKIANLVLGRGDRKK